MTSYRLICIPLGGLGTRFKNLGYTQPKPLINVLGKPILYWLFDNLSFPENIKYTILIPYNNELSNYHFEDRLKKDYPKFNFVFKKLKNNTNGAAETVLIMLKQWNENNINDCPLICLDGDNFYNDDILRIWEENINKNRVFVFEDYSNEPIYSYVKLKTNQNQNASIELISEKQKISNLACCGAYAFQSWKKMMSTCQKIVDQDIRQKNEYYLSTTISQMLLDKEEFLTALIKNDDYVCLGTPLHVRIFCNNLPRISALTSKCLIESRRICFDLDNTLVTFPSIPGDYTTVKPIEHNIQYVNYLKKLGNTIIIYTARRMKTNKGNVGAVMADIGQITFDTLSKFNIHYDEIYFGKPNADFYIDDLMISPYSNLEKELGYYSSSIKPRHFNNLENRVIHTYKKSSNEDLSGEIYFYQNIPNQIKDMFPLLIDYDSTHSTFYEIEKIKGIPVSKLFISHELNVTLLDYIISSLKRIHAVTLTNNAPDKDINIYSNYSEKIKTRYHNNHKLYSDLDNNSDNLYNHLIKLLDIYEKNKHGKLGIIHGDPVFTNILVNSFGKLKFIDMRGKLGNKSTLYGDIFYDFAKIYQSLIGYDEILTHGCLILDPNYRETLIKSFRKHFTDPEFDNIQIITKSLLFSLIPLHKNKQNRLNFYNLIEF